jgi:Allophanate hydrolase subunit 1
VKVPQGAVGITEQFTNIYTFQSPGGWNILGNTPIKVFDNKDEKKPNLINPGDTVVFREISLEEYQGFNHD